MDFIQAILNATKPGQKELTTDQMLKIDELVNASREEQEKILAKAAYKGHVAGDLQAQQALKIKISFDQVNQEAVKYAKSYAKDLAQGGCYIHGKWVPWLESKTREERDKIATIIQEGYKAGKATGVKQYKKEGKYGLYPKGTIAGDLQEYFTGLKSHASMVARTEIARVQVAGSLNRYKKQGVKKILWLTFKPCGICEQFNRRVYAIDKMPSEIPVHPNCRCAAAPVPDDVPAGPAPEQPVPSGFAQPLPATNKTPMTGKEIREQARAKYIEAEKEMEARYETEIERLRIVYIEKTKAFDNYWNKVADVPHNAATRAKLKQLKEEMHRSWEPIAAKIEARKAEREAFAATNIRKEMHDMLYVRKESPIKHDIYWEQSTLPSTQKRVDEALDFVGRVVHEKTAQKLNGTQITVSKAVKREYAIKTTRGEGFDRVTGGRIFCNHLTPTSTIVHEIGHCIEFSDKMYKRAANVFLDRRTAGEEAQQLRKLTKKNFDPSEIAKPDKFRTPYIGKIYGDKYTEVISMGIQYLYEDPLKFAEEDPDMFDFIVDLLRADPTDPANAKRKW